MRIVHIEAFMAEEVDDEALSAELLKIPKTERLYNLMQVKPALSCDRCPPHRKGNASRPSRCWKDNRKSRY
jgi:hypothetical protein